MSAEQKIQDQVFNDTETESGDDQVNGPTAEQKIFREMKQRLRSQQNNEKKQQPWKKTHRVAPEDVPIVSGLLYKKPWYHGDKFPEFGDSTHGA